MAFEQFREIQNLVLLKGRKPLVYGLRSLHLPSDHLLPLLSPSDVLRGLHFHLHFRLTIRLFSYLLVNFILPISSLCCSYCVGVVPILAVDLTR